jgi:hypothetical protein
MTPMIDSNLEGDHPVWRMLFETPQCAVRAGCEDDKEYAITNAGTNVYDRQVRIRRTSHIRISIAMWPADKHGRRRQGE